MSCFGQVRPSSVYGSLDLLLLWLKNVEVTRVVREQTGLQLGTSV